MPFKEITERVNSTSYKAPFSIRIKRRKNGKPTLFVSIRAEALAQLGWKAKDKIKLAVGAGADAGKIQLEPSASGIGNLKVLSGKGRQASGVVDFGFVEAIGATPSRSIPIEGIVSGKALTITLPRFADFPEAAAKPAKENVAAAAEPPSEAPERNSAVNGVTVRLNGERSIVAHQGKTIVVTERQAGFVRGLAKALDGGILDYDRIRQHSEMPRYEPSLMAEDFVPLERALPAIGLRIRYQPKMGYSLATK